MVEKVEAWRSRDGAIHHTRMEAARADAYNALFDIGDIHMYTQQIVDHWEKVHAALTPLAQARDEAAPTFRAKGA